MTTRIDQQLAFLIEADKLKSVLRGTTLNDSSRFENSAEHSWHVILFALTMAEHANSAINIDRVIKMLLIHDLVEIDAGDVPIHSAAARDGAQQELAEQAAATRIFSLLPQDQGNAFRTLWDEFEAAQTPDAIFAKSIDRVQPVVSNLQSGGQSWRDYNVTREQLDTRVGQKVKLGANAIWNRLKQQIDAWFLDN